MRELNCVVLIFAHRRRRRHRDGGCAILQQLRVGLKIGPPHIRNRRRRHSGFNGQGYFQAGWEKRGRERVADQSNIETLLVLSGTRARWSGFGRSLFIRLMDGVADSVGDQKGKFY